VEEKDAEPVAEAPAEEEIPPEPEEPEAPEEVPAEREPDEKAKEEEEPVPFLIASYLDRLKEEPDDHEVRLALARAYRDEARIANAFQEFHALVNSGRMVKELLPDLEGLCDSYPDDPDWHQLLGDAYMKANQLTDALKAYRAAQDALEAQ
jgi:tetratricopeptide (TPR) repeat protein